MLNQLRDWVRRKWHIEVSKYYPPESQTPRHVYSQDGLRSIHNHDFLWEPKFSRAYRRAVQAAQKDYEFHWRVHVGIWAAQMALKTKGDFVECGVNKGALSSAILEFLDWESLGRHFYLFDSFAGRDSRHYTQEEKLNGIQLRNENEIQSGFYTTSFHEVKKNFSEWKRIHLIQGFVPESLKKVSIQAVAYLHLDMNSAAPEVAAAEYFWPLLSPGGVLLMDDYGYRGYHPQKIALDKFSKQIGTPILSLPTGQGLLVKPTIVQ